VEEALWKIPEGAVNVFHYELELQLTYPNGRVNAIRARLSTYFWPDGLRLEFDLSSKPLLIVTIDDLEVGGVGVCEWMYEAELLVSYSSPVDGEISLRIH